MSEPCYGKGRVRPPRTLALNANTPVARHPVKGGDHCLTGSKESEGERASNRSMTEDRARDIKCRIEKNGGEVLVRYRRKLQLAAVGKILDPA